jgi:hypothetical protein
VLAAWTGGLAAAAALAACVGVSASSAKLAFDSVVQRDAPDANRGRSFAKFETRFQLTWVVGAFIPVIVTIPVQIGFLVVAACGGFALFSYVAGLRALGRGQLPAQRPNPVVRSIRSAVDARRRGGKGDRPASPPTAPPPPPPPPYDRARELDAADVDATTVDRDDAERRNGRNGGDRGPGDDRTVIIDPTKLQ